MKKYLEFTSGENLSAGLVERVDEIFHGENLIQMVLHAHLVVERAITKLISKNLKRPEVLEDGTFGRWSFHQKIGLYVALCDPSADTERCLLGLNRLRNSLAHDFHDEEACIAKCLPWDGTGPAPRGRNHVAAVVGVLFFDLGILKGVRRIDLDPDGA